ncbi:hypothetical protein CW735_15610 [Alteromonas sp. MB-3u-76]|uniref:hypothetical protein n=1 Tax=Alteromonas sp. MB-3u-76 TaxID=2058133 RepID=UPI000C30B726|nr:hypothetical protein [Alteromonas sp. MB-3u-76]AUC89439.1 hypothetical protein CW735_15610 [Alteromonas sp. MB-3u-76]
MLNKATYLSNFIQREDDEAFESIAADWSEDIDLNLEFRHQIVDSLTAESIASPVFIKALLEAEVEYCVQNWCGTSELRLLGKLFHPLTKHQYLDFYNECRTRSYDIE